MALEAAAEHLIVPSDELRPLEVKLRAQKPLPINEIVPQRITYTVHNQKTGEFLTKGTTAIYVEPHRIVPHLDGVSRDARATAAPIQVDGRLDEWPKLKYYSHRSARVHLAGGGAGRHRGPETASFSFGVVQDTTYLYLGIQVRDAKVIRRAPDGDKPAPVDHSDSLLLTLDANLPEIRRAAEMGGEARGRLDIQVQPGNRPQDPPLLKEPEALPDGAQIVSVLTEEGYNVEVALPHKYLDSLQEEPWGSLRLNVTQLDYDDGTMRNPWPERLEIQWQPQWRTPESYLESGLFVREPQAR